MDYGIFRYFEDGRVRHCATFSTSEKAYRVKKEWEQRNPSASYQVHEI